MQTEGILENNCVSISGNIVEECAFSHKVYGEGFYVFKVSVERLSDNADILPVMISERLIDRNLLKTGAKVEISGQLRSYNNYTDKKSRLVLTVFARDIQIVDEYTIKNPNQIYLNGYICKEPVYRETPFGREISDILVAVNRAYNKSDYIPCIAWGRNARFTSKLSVGSNIRLWGRVQSRAYQKKKDDVIEEKVAYEVSVSKIETVSDDINRENIRD
ncbi:single-stranded DNA-binding protein [Tyzzerella sp. An114]|mgnify:FL=1|uniref:single-stranded DNA-binding protein n=1 Tax=Tyzzerella sp. An114 TaxID=1965545 RepID=UPI000B433951|nr:single-stranded DNA-binding protein [Tyzzerella sp. An114]OUQ58882.1 single-stranded DNA-binding protein [Tyzzerella sp. An114]HIT72882.1 single-stranded DNA-binding protein [Candidatus Fimicola cottocaccae]